MVKHFLKPRLHVKTLLQIPLQEIVSKGINGLIIDLDNTITEWNSPKLRKEFIEWFKLLSAYNIKACIASNNNKERVEQIGISLGIPAIYKACKPRKRAFRKAIRIMGTDIKSTAVIGDQLFTDILGGNRLGLYTILVTPLNSKEFLVTRMVRKVEHLFLKALLEKRSQYEN
ncbi:YqeG family HAD IIIA-type phosphatase [Bacillota bacterium LX-D]|nr:YqeG family HAD IIIA-type phosphatase [Bacillota bacterium LX-D]